MSHTWAIHEPPSWIFELQRKYKRNLGYRKKEPKKECWFLFDPFLNRKDRHLRCQNFRRCAPKNTWDFPALRGEKNFICILMCVCIFCLYLLYYIPRTVLYCNNIDSYHFYKCFVTTSLNITKKCRLDSCRDNYFCKLVSIILTMINLCHIFAQDNYHNYEAWKFLRLITTIVKCREAYKISESLFLIYIYTYTYIYNYK